jgi:hypothetical protein
MKGAALLRWIAIASCLAPLGSALAAPRIVDIRVGKHGAFQRIVIEFADEVAIVARELPGAASDGLLIEMGAELDRAQSFGARLTRTGEVTIEPGPEGATLQARGTLGAIRMFRLFEPARLVVDFSDRPLELPEGSAPVPVAPLGTPPPDLAEGTETIAPSPEPTLEESGDASSLDELAGVSPDTEPPATSPEADAGPGLVEPAPPADEPDHTALEPGPPLEPAESFEAAESAAPAGGEPARPELETFAQDDVEPELPRAERDPFALPEGTPEKARELAPALPAPAAPPAAKGEIDLPPTGAAPRPLGQIVRFVPGGVALLAVIGLAAALAYLLGRRRAEPVLAPAGIGALLEPAGDTPAAETTISPQDLRPPDERTAELERRLDEEIRERRRLEARLVAIYEEQKVMRDRVSRLLARNRDRLA